MKTELKERMQELRDLASLVELAQWDQDTYMPKKGAEGRGAALGTLKSLYHQRLVDPYLGEWLDAPDAQGFDEDAMVRVLRRERSLATKVPERLVRALAEAGAAGLAAWKRARDEQRFGTFAPALEHTVRLRREYADALGTGDERYDALLDAYEPGMRSARLAPVFSELQAVLVPLVQAIEARPKPVDVFGGKTWADAAQWAFTMELLPAVGFDLDAGRQDRSVHPFSSGQSVGDVRLTTRVSLDTPLPAIFGTLHEAGHGLFEQGFAPKDFRTPLAQSPSLGLHESQSRLWENLVGRSLPFWKHHLPRLRRHFPSELDGVDVETFWKAVNRVERTFIRVEADEVTYNLHVILRFQIERALLRGELDVKDVDAAWNEKTRTLLGLTVQRAADGALQDVHWAWGDFGYFPTYTLGNLYGASLFAAAQRALPNLWVDVERGDCSALLRWLRATVHHAGYRWSTEALIEKVTGRGLVVDDFAAYVRQKYGALYGL